jgi:phenylalanyl-tRNA synthetase beta chain
MRVPLSWLKEFVDITLAPAELAFRLTVAGAEVSKVAYIGIAPPVKNEWGVNEEVGLVWARDKIVVAQIVEVMPHPNADRLVLADVNYGADSEAVHRVVTGAPNLFHWKGQGKLPNGPKVVFAMEGAQLYDGHAEGQKLMTLKASKIRGIPSNAMVCSEKELGLSDEHEGIIILADDAPVGAPLADYWGDVVLHVEILPNIARCQSIIGVAREVAALTGATFKGESVGKLNTNPQLPITNYQSDWIKIEIHAPALCPRFTATLIRNVTLTPSPEWMQRRLQLTGVRAINNVVDITNYVMMESGKPIHAFDYDKLLARAQRDGVHPPLLLARRAYEGEHIVTLDGVDRALSNDMVMVADSSGAVAVGGIMGGAETEIDANTRNVLIESASWNFINNRKTAQTLKLPSEATARFGRGVPDSSTVPSCLRAADLMRQLAGAEVAPELVDCYPNPKASTVVNFDTREIKRLLGIDVTIERIKEILESLEFKVTLLETITMRSMQYAILEITVPEHRLDVSIPADIVEEIARIIGYDQIPATRMMDELPPQRRNVSLEAEDRMRDILVGAGLQEIISYPLTTVEREALLYPDPTQADLDASAYIALANPISPERRVMRHTLMHSLLDVAREALRHRERVLLFEIGRAYVPQSSEPLPNERARLTIVLAGSRDATTWLGKTSPRMDFFDMKGVVDALVRGLQLPDVKFTPSEHPTLHPARAATLSAGETLIGVFGEAHPQVREQFALPFDPVCLAEFEVDALMRCMGAPKFKALPRFPAVREDIALIVNDDLPAAQVEALIWESGGAMLRSVTLFDVYRGEQLGAGKKSLAYALAYQHDERTLTDDEAAKIRGRIVKKVTDTLGAELRG